MKKHVITVLSYQTYIFHLADDKTGKKSHRQSVTTLNPWGPSHILASEYYRHMEMGSFDWGQTSVVWRTTNNTHIFFRNLNVYLLFLPRALECNSTHTLCVMDMNYTLNCVSYYYFFNRSNVQLSPRGL